MRKIRYITELFVSAAVFLCVLISCTQPQRFSSAVTDERAIKSDIKFEGGDGSSEDSAIKISGARNVRDVVNAENSFLEKTFGERDVDWKFVTGHFKTSHLWALQNQPPLTVKK